jgi:F-type H+-transporting ATPase subunit delta
MSAFGQVINKHVQESVSGLASTAIGIELFTVANLLEVESRLRRNLADSGLTPEVRANLVKEIFSSRISKEAMQVVEKISATRWFKDSSLVEAIESAGALVVLAATEKGKNIDRVEEEIFFFARLVDRNSDLQMALSGSASKTATKAKLVTDLLSGQAHADTVTLVAQFVAHTRGRRLSQALDNLSALAAARHNKVVATVITAINLNPKQKSRISAAIGSIYNCEVVIDAVVNPAVIGGVSVQVGDDVIDGTISTRIQSAARQLQA